MDFSRPFTCRLAPLVRDHVDTDQIIPARFLRGTQKTGLGQHAFADWRGPDFVLDQPPYAGCDGLLAGVNFGCGSSREHAPWALTDAGLRVIVARSFADIFRGNALRNGLLPIALEPDAHAALVTASESGAPVSIEVDLASATVALPDGSKQGFPVDPFAQHCLLEGIDAMDYLLAALPSIEAFEGAEATAVAAGGDRG